jgi:cobalt/nickel transport system permease protein
MEIRVSSLDNRNNFLLGVETRVKIIAVFCLVFVAVSLRTLPALSAGACLALGLLVWARVPPIQYAKRILWLLPFAGIMLLFMPFVTPGQEAASFSLMAIKISATREGIEKAFIFPAGSWSPFSPSVF